MRIGLVIERMEPWRGGAETSTAQFAGELVSRGHEVRLFTASRGVSEQGVQVITLSVPGNRSGRARAFAAAVEAARAEHPCDVMHSMTPLFGGDVFMPRGGTVAETIEGNLRIRRSPLARDFKRLTNLLNRRQQALLQMERALLTGSACPPRVAAVSGYVVEQLRRHYRLGPDRVREVFNAVTVPEVSEAEAAAARAEVRAEWALPADSFVMLFVGHNFKLKGLAQLIDAAGRLAQRQGRLDWHLLIVGRDRPGPYLARADRWGVARRVVFVGPSERAWRFYLAADLFVLPTFYDPCSRVVLESVCLGTPVVTTRYNGAGEILVGESGHPPRVGGQPPPLVSHPISAGTVIADPHDTAELVRAIEAYALAPARRRAAGQAGRALRDFLSMRRHADQMIEVYEQVIAQKCPAGGAS